MECTWLGRSVRRLGRISIGWLASVAGLAVFAAATRINFFITDEWFWEVCGVAGLITAVAVFGFCERIGLVPDDSDPPTTLSLSNPSPGKPSPNGDRDERDPRASRWERRTSGFRS
jgi:hypothetical protein